MVAVANRARQLQPLFERGLRLRQCAECQESVSKIEASDLLLAPVAQFARDLQSLSDGLQGHHHIALLTRDMGLDIEEQGFQRTEPMGVRSCQPFELQSLAGVELT